MPVKIERIIEGQTLGEGPHWDAATQSLFYVDLLEKTINKYVPATKKVTTATMDKHVSFIVPVEGKKDQFVVSLDRDLVLISWDGESPKATIVEVLASVDQSPDKVKNHFNDGKCDPSGRLWAGTLQLNIGDLDGMKAVGSIYSLGPNKELKVFEESKIRLANGLAFDDGRGKMFYNDSLKGTIDRFDYDPKSGNISNRQVLFSLDKHDIVGLPDGMAIDTEGNLWVAVFNSFHVYKVSSTEPETLLDSIELPAEMVTSVAFGGKNLDELFVTTARFEQQGRTFEPPINGAIYKVTGTGAKGLPGVSYKL